MLCKFENVDVFDCLKAIMDQNTGFYQSDFEIDKEIMTKAMSSCFPTDRKFVWFCRPSGTHCFRERDVFLKESRAHNTLCFYKEQTRDRILAYVVDMKDSENGIIRGNLYELDYVKYYAHVKSESLPADTNRLIYENGERYLPAKQYFSGSPDPKLGKFVRYEPMPNNTEDLLWLLRSEQQKRDSMHPGDFKAHIAALHEGLIKSEAINIMDEMKHLNNPNSPDKSHYMVALSSPFLHLVSQEDIKKLSSMLPYKSLKFSKGDKYHIVYAVIDKDEKDK